MLPIPIAIGIGSIFLLFHQKTGIKMYEQFIELTDQIFWEGYAEQLAHENPARFQQEISDFFNLYQY